MRNEVWKGNKIILNQNYGIESERAWKCSLTRRRVARKGDGIIRHRCPDSRNCIPERPAIVVVDKRATFLDKPRENIAFACRYGYPIYARLLRFSGRFYSRRTKYASDRACSSPAVRILFLEDGKARKRRAPRTPAEDVFSAIRRSFSARRTKSDLPSVRFAHGGESERSREAENKRRLRKDKKKKGGKEGGDSPRGKARGYVCFCTGIGIPKWISPLEIRILSRSKWKYYFCNLSNL